MNNMRVICINSNGWYLHEGNYFGFLESGKQSEVAGPENGAAYTVISSFVERQGDLCYIINGHGDCGWEADCFIVPGDTAVPNSSTKSHLDMW